MGDDKKGPVLPTGPTPAGGSAPPPGKKATTAGKRMVDGTFVVFDAEPAKDAGGREQYVVHSAHPEKAEAMELAQADLLSLNPRIMGVTYVPWGADIQAAIRATIKAARG